MYHINSKVLAGVVLFSISLYLIVGYAVGALGMKVTNDLIKQTCKIERKIERRTGEPMSVECQKFFDKARKRK